MDMPTRNIGFPSSSGFASLWTFFLAVHLFPDVAEADDCSSKPIVVPIKNVTFEDGIAMNRGIQIVLGDQIQGFRISTILNNTRIRNILDCPAASNTTGFLSCWGSSGGVYNTTDGTFRRVYNDKDWDVTVIDSEPTDGTTVLRGYDVGNFTDGSAVIPEFPVEVWGNSNALNKSALALGPRSSVLKHLMDQGIISNPSFSIDYCSRSELFSCEGQLVLGGVNEARYDPDATKEFPMWGADGPVNCPLQVLLKDVVLTNESGDHTLFADSNSKVSACIDTIQNAFTFTPSMFARWQQLTNHIDDDGSSYGQQSYPTDREPMIGTLTIRLTNGYTTTIPHYELLSHERGSDAQGKYVITNNSRVMAAVQSGQSDLGNDVPILGGVFLSQNYIHVDYGTNKFWLSPRIKGAAPADRISYTTGNQTCIVNQNRDLGLKVGLPVALVVVTIGGLLAWQYRHYWLPFVRTHFRLGGKQPSVESSSAGGSSNGSQIPEVPGPPIPEVPGPSILEVPGPSISEVPGTPPPQGRLAQRSTATNCAAAATALESSSSCLATNEVHELSVIRAGGTSSGPIPQSQDPL